MGKIREIKAKQILDSKGIPTVEVDLKTEQGVFQASAPSGTSKGKYEARELRDACLPAGREGDRYKGKGVLKAVKNVNQIIGPKLQGKDPARQKEIDHLMIELDGTDNKSNLGGNAILPVSMAVCRAGAAVENVPLYKHLSEISHTVFRRILLKTVSLPTPVLLLIEGGLHAGGKLDVQEFMIAPEAESFSEKLRIGTEIYHTLGKILRKKYGSFAINVGLEGGYAPPVCDTETALELIMEAIKTSGYEDKVKLVLDMAASHFFEQGSYQFEGRAFTNQGLLNFYSDLIKEFPILGLEDPFDQEDWEGWKRLKSKVKSQKSKIVLIGDDLTVTNPKRIRQARENKTCNAVVLKPNQIGTVTETIEAAKLAKDAGWEIFVKHRSGETNDTFISDLAVGLGVNYIMAGAPCRGERVAKYNRLLEINYNL